MQPLPFSEALTISTLQPRRQQLSMILYCVHELDRHEIILDNFRICIRNGLVRFSSLHVLQGVAPVRMWYIAKLCQSYYFSVRFCLCQSIFLIAQYSNNCELLVAIRKQRRNRSLCLPLSLPFLFFLLCFVNCKVILVLRKKRGLRSASCKHRTVVYLKKTCEIQTEIFYKTMRRDILLGLAIRAIRAAAMTSVSKTVVATPRPKKRR